MHHILERQIKRHLNGVSVDSPEFKELFDAVSRTYEDYEEGRKLAERSLELSSKEMNETFSLLKTSFELLLEGILVMSIHGKIQLHNTRFMQIWGIPEHLIGFGEAEKVFEYISELIDTTKSRTAYTKNILDCSTEETHRTLVLKDGRIIEEHTKPQIFEGVVNGRLWICIDITEQQRYESEIKEKLSQLEDVNKIMIGRELRMIELKEEIQKLQKAESLWKHKKIVKP